MSIYQSLYDLLNQYVFGNVALQGSYIDLVLIIASTIGCLFLVTLPFIIVWRFIKLWF